MIFFSSFQPEREFKVYKSCKCSQIYAVEYKDNNNTVCSLDCPFQFRFFFVNLRYLSLNVGLLEITLKAPLEEISILFYKAGSMLKYI